MLWLNIPKSSVTSILVTLISSLPIYLIMYYTYFSFLTSKLTKLNLAYTEYRPKKQISYVDYNRPSSGYV